MKKIENFDKYMAEKGLNDNRVTVDLGLSVGTIGKSRKDGRDLSDKVVEQILNFYTDINKVWLLTGEGDMLRATPPVSPSAQPVPCAPPAVAADNPPRSATLPQSSMGGVPSADGSHTSTDTVSILLAQIRDLQDKIDRLNREIGRKEAEIAAKEAEIAAKEAEIAALRAQIRPSGASD